jgi:SAM-dependent methyltransferase
LLAGRVTEEMFRMTGQPTASESAIDQRDPFALDVLAKFALAHTIFAAFEIGLWEGFHDDPEHALDVDAFVAERGLEPRIVRGIVDHLRRRDVLVAAGDRYCLGPRGRHLIAEGWLAYVAFYVGGYRDVLAATTAMAKGDSRYGTDVIRNTHYVALGTEMMSRTAHHASYEVVLGRAAQLRPRRVADVGCGSAHFLIQLVDACGSDHGLGVDVSASACQLANDNVLAAGRTGRIEIVQCDMRRLLQERSDLAGSFDVITSMMVVHESLYGGEWNTVQLLRDLSRALVPGTGRMLILDKQTDVLDAGRTPPYFTEYKLVHDLTYQDLCDQAGWERIISAAGMRLESVQKLPEHTGSILLECCRRDS